MKLIIAIVRPYHVELLLPAVKRRQWNLISVGELRTEGQDQPFTVVFRDRVVTVRRPKFRVELTVSDHEADVAVATIRAETAAGCPGNMSDAKIMVLQMDEIMPTKPQPPAARAVNKQALCAV